MIPKMMTTMRNSIILEALRCLAKRPITDLYALLVFEVLRSRFSANPKIRLAGWTNQRICRGPGQVTADDNLRSKRDRP